MAQSTGGIAFRDGAWQDVLAAAKESGKPIFVDVYTSWCLPCKRMEKEIFPLPQAGAKYNTSFINYRVDAEKGEGIAINKKYAVGSYPTFLFINPDGVLLYRGVGYNEDPTVFLSFADNALQRSHSKLTIADRKKMYAAGERKPAFVMEYIAQLSELGMKEDASAALDAYMESLPGNTWRDTANARLFLAYVNAMSSKVFDTILTHQSYFPTIGLPDNSMAPEITISEKTAKLSAMLSNIMMASLMNATSTKNKALFNDVTAHANRLQHPGIKFPYTLFAFSLQFYASTHDTAAIISTSKTFLHKVMDMDAARLKRSNDTFYHSFLQPYLSGQADSTKITDFEAVKNKQQQNFSNYVALILFAGADRYLNYAQLDDDLKEAIKWNKRALQIGEKRPEYLHTLALLYDKTGQRKKALTTQQEAIDIAQQKKADEKTLEKYRADLADMKRQHP